MATTVPQLRDNLVAKLHDVVVPSAERPAVSVAGFCSVGSSRLFWLHLSHAKTIRRYILLSYISKKCLNSVYNGEKIVVLERNPDNKCFWFTTGTDRHLSNVHVPRLFDTPILKTRPLAHLRDARPTLRAARISNDPSVEPREGLRPVVHVPKVFAFGPTLKRRLFVFLPCFRRNWTP